MHAPAHDLAEFEKELARQTLISERSRCSLLAGALGLLLGVMIVYSVALAGTPGALPGMTGVMIVVAFAALFEFGTSQLLTHLLRTGRTRPPFAPYLSTFIEMALPTCAMLILAHADTPHSAINSAAPYGYVLYIILSALRLEFRPCLFAGALAALGYGALMLAYWPHLEGAWTGSLSLLRLTLLLRVILLFLGGLAAAFVSMRIKTTLLETLRETQERARIVDLFGQHVSPAVVNQLLTQPIGETSEQRDVCILVLDIRNFTTFSEDGDADEVVAYLNCLWSSTVEAVNDHGGIVNKFLGDGFLAVFARAAFAGKRLPQRHRRRAAHPQRSRAPRRRRPDSAHARRHRPARRPRRRRQHRLARSQGIHRHRRRGERGLPHRGTQQGTRLHHSSLPSPSTPPPASTAPKRSPRFPSAAAANRCSSTG